LPAKLSLVVAASMLSPALLHASESSDEQSAQTSSQQSSSSETSQSGSQQGSETLNQIAEQQSDISEFVKAVEKAGMAESLTSDTEYTIFAPTNDALESDSDLQQLLESDDPQDQEKLVELLRAHIVADDVDAEMARTIGKAKTIGGGEVELTTDGEKLKVGDAEVVTADIQQDNLRIHAIDGVLEPSASASMATSGSSSESSTSGSSSTAGMDFDELDQDGDGYLSEEELQQAEQLQAQQDQLDSNQDGRVSRTEFAAFEREQGSSSETPSSSDQRSSSDQSGSDMPPHHEGQEDWQRDE